MNWESERWIKLYTRDVGDWVFLSFDAQALFLLLMRKVNETGTLSLGRRGAEAIPVLLGHAGAAARVSEALKALLDDGCVRLCGEDLVIVNFREAQEAITSPAERKRRQREREACHAVSREVTRSHAVSLLEESRVEEKEIKQELVARERAPGSAFQAFLKSEWPDIKNPAEYEQRAREAHPGLDLLAEAKKARGWEIANPRKAKSNHGNYFYRWLSKAEQFLAQNAPPDAAEKRKADAGAAKSLEQTKQRNAALAAIVPVRPPDLKALMAKIGNGK